ncbi:MAG: carbohydrate ABC transporter permease [Caldilineaceae bacterium SB0662_bin_9]|uniref:Carbohydrate ABC transporter permease n=1 Tax=Caldilineaceae bacterium SB0662_bin_9 TaxID=2605258 RepID=A0A6B1DZL4_9CHLR|nr:carbohydrate ABC transporter permease [Caldilineaceae bacterium]MYD92053.1 carbohydrate ABC transporter permease [Caldilineaceae bacterium SB0662_bin_9]
MTSSAPALKPAPHITSPWRNLRQGILHVFLGFMTIVALFPFVWMVFASFKPFKELVQSKALLPINWTTENYTEILTRVNFEVAVANSIYSAVTVTVITLLTSSALGFIFAKYRFWGKEYLFILLLSTMMVPFAVVLVPLYITIGDLNLVNKLWGFIITGLWSTFGVFLMRQFMEVIPYEYLDAARIDGASEWRIFFTIIIPLSTSPMAALGIFAFLANWDSFLWPLVVLNTPDKQTLPLLLAGLRSIYWARYDMWSAGSVMTTVPIILVYAFASKYFIRGMALTGIKG